VPSGVYAAGGVEERFTCAPGPAGWRLTASRSDGASFDVTVDRAGRPVRVELRAGSHVVRGGLVGRDRLGWVRDGVEASAVAVGFAGDGVGWWAVAGRALLPVLRTGTPLRRRVVRVSGPSLAALTVEERWELLGVQVHEGLPVAALRVTDLGTGEAVSLHLAGDVVVAGDGVELLSLETPPSLDVLPVSDAGAG